MRVAHGCFMLLFFVIVFSNCTNSVQETNQPRIIGPDNSKYGFETGTMGWNVQTAGDSRACKSVSWSDSIVYSGAYSLEVDVSLLGGDTILSKGEVWVNMKENPPSGISTPIDLSGKEICACVFTPPGSAGNMSRPNGLQLFVKDQQWKSLYGSWKNNAAENWNHLNLTVNDTKPSGGWIDSGFDPTAIIAVGVKIATGQGSSAIFNGTIHIDSIDWN